jgi:hypothetical protein
MAQNDDLYRTPLFHNLILYFILKRAKKQQHALFKKKKKIFVEMEQKTIFILTFNLQNLLERYSLLMFLEPLDMKLSFVQYNLSRY